jgi:hypothetical protein
LLMPDAVPACRLSTALMTVVVSGATLTAMPRGHDLIVRCLDLIPRLQTGRGFSRLFVHRLIA